MTVAGKIPVRGRDQDEIPIMIMKIGMTMRMKVMRMKKTTIMKTSMMKEEARAVQADNVDLLQ